MSYPVQGALAELPRSQQPTQHASGPVYDYPEQSPGYGSGQPYPYPAAPNYGMPYYAQAYGAPAFGGYAARRRPGVVTAAAVLGFIIGGLDILLYGLGLLVVVSISAGQLANHGSLLTVILFAVVLLGLTQGALYVWGGVSAVRGRGRKLLLSIAAIHESLVLLSLVFSLAVSPAQAGHAVLQALLGSIFALPILILILQRSSSEYFRNRGGMTN